jgi:DNA-binding HxlR family transcriptional regulator
VTRRRLGARSHCPISFALDLFGDQWTLLVVRDMMLFGKRTFQDFLASGEGVATNVLTDRLRRLEQAGVITTRRDPDDRRRVLYLLTERGIDLMPMMVEMVAWSAKHDPKSLATPEKLAELRAGHRRLAAALHAELAERPRREAS